MATLPVPARIFRPLVLTVPVRLARRDFNSPVRHQPTHGGTSSPPTTHSAARQPGVQTMRPT
jgi:hypothetical protein